MSRELSVTGEQTVELPPDPYQGRVTVTLIRKEADQNPLRQLLADTDGKKNEPELLEPPLDAGMLLRLYGKSAGLKPNVDAMATNVDAFGYMLEPAVTLGAPDSAEHVREALLVDRLLRAARTEGSDGPTANTQTLEDELAPLARVAEPTEEEVEQYLKLLRRLALIEAHQLRTFFSICCAEMSFVELRRQTREDRESTGNAYWEATRDQRGVIARFVKMPVESVRMTGLDPAPTLVQEKVRSSALSWTTVPQMRFFRRYAQVATGPTAPYGDKLKVLAWFKEFGDPRALSRKTGKAYSDVAALKAAEGEGAVPATEVLHFRIYTAGSPYGVPRWCGNMPGVLGSRELDEINEAYFDNNAVPPLALLVSGGRLAAGVTNKLGDLFESKKGLKNFHRMVTIEAEAAPTTASQAPSAPNLVPKISFERLRDVQLEDGLFQVYDQRNREKLDASFRIPQALKGGVAELAALRQTDPQVFAPERCEFDELMNRRILPELGVRFWRFRSNGPPLQDHEALGRLIVDLTNAAAVRPDEARELASVILQKQLLPIDEDWAKRPLALTLGMLRAMSGPAEAVRVGAGTTESAEAVRSATVDGGKPKPVTKPTAPPARRAPRGRNGRAVPAPASEDAAGNEEE